MAGIFTNIGRGIKNTINWLGNATHEQTQGALGLADFGGRVLANQDPGTALTSAASDLSASNLPGKQTTGNSVGPVARPFDLRSGAAYSYTPPAQPTPSVNPQVDSQALAKLYNAPGNFYTQNNQVSGGYDSTGALALFNQPAQQTKEEQSLIPNINPTPSTSTLGQGGTEADVYSMIQKHLNAQDQLFSRLAGLSTVPQSEIDLQNKAAEANRNINALQAQAAGAYNPSGNPDLAFVTGSARNSLYSAQLQSQLAQAQLAYAQGNRQFAFNSAKDIFDASRNNFASMMDIYSKAAPQNLATNYNPTSGQLTTVMRNPLTGAEYTKDLGNIGAQKTYVNITSPTLDPNTGQYTVTAFKSDGSYEKIPLTGGASGLGSTGSTANFGAPIGNMNGLQVFDTAAANPTLARPDRNNNPGNIKVSNFTSSFPGVVGVEARPATDGGNFLVFSSPQAGFNAMASLLQTGKSYQGVTAEQAIKRWNNGGAYGAADVGLNPNADFQSQIKDPNKLLDVVHKMASKEGYTGALATQNQNTTASNTSPLSYQQLQQMASFKVANAIKPLPDGAGYIDYGALKDEASVIQAQLLSKQYGVPILKDNETKDVQDVIKAIANLKTLWTDFSSLAANSTAGAFGQNISGPLGKLFNTNTGNKLAAFQGNRDALFQQINALAGSAVGGRLNQNELTIAKNALPRLDEFNHDTLQSGQEKVKLVQQYLDNGIRAYMPQYTGDTLGISSVNGPGANTGSFTQADAAYVQSLGFK